VYSPENFHFEGYTQFPKPVAAPYTNEKQKIKQDWVINKRSREALNSMRSKRESFESKWNKKLVEKVLNDSNFA
jgi:hypothetical protein